MQEATARKVLSILDSKESDFWVAQPKEPTVWPAYVI